MEAMRVLADAGVPCGVMIAPVVPGITDSEAQLEAVIAAAADHGASFVSPNVLHLRPGTKEWFMPALREAYPHLTEKYERWYTGSYAPKQYTEQVIAKISELRDRWGFADRHRKPAPVRGQMSLGL
jgi:DNA repair photolyase